MSLTPLDIRKKEFRKVMRGCDPVQVEAFLEEVSDLVMALVEDKNELQTQVEQLQGEKKLLTAIKPEPEKEESVTEKELAEREAKMIIREAEVKAYEILERAKAENNRLKEETIVLKSQKSSFLKRLKHIISSQLEMIDVLSLDDFDDKDVEHVRKTVEKASKTNVSEDVLKIDPKDLFTSKKEEKVDDVALDLNVVKNGDMQPIDNVPFILKKKKKKPDLPEAEKHSETEEKNQQLHKNLFNSKIDDDFERILGEIGK